MRETGDPGQIVVINGPSSVGKTSTAKALQLQLDPQFLRLSDDSWILDVWPKEDRGDLGTGYVGVTPTELDKPEPDNIALVFSPDGYRIMEGLYIAIQALSLQGYNIIVDVTFWERRFLEDCVRHLQELPVLLVRLHCPLEIILERFEARPDAQDLDVGLAHFWFHRTAEVDQLIDYDLELDTSTLTPEQCATQIANLLDRKPPPTSFRKLVGRLGK